MSALIKTLRRRWHRHARPCWCQLPPDGMDALVAFLNGKGGPR